MSSALSLFDLTGRVAIITGGSKGLGKTMAEALASAGANILIANRNLPEAQQVADQISKTYNVKAVGTSVNVTDQLQTEAMAKLAMDTFGRIDILINSAGINIRGAIDELSYADFNAVMDVNVNGTWLASKAVIPHMKAAKSGKIINLASTLGLVGLANRTPYNASKGAIVNMTRGLGLELAPFNINVNAICPGPFLTEMNIPFADTPEFKNFVIGATALQRWAQLPEIQGIALMLASNASNYMCGSMVTVDGGWTAR
jgi:NAD(P)-dependent dehydrogenase (short-subunit alcohol dehydrogenase family)